jgi:aconitate hydratase
MLAAGLVARNAVRRGLQVKPWVKTSLAPGSRAVSAYLRAAGLQGSLDALGFQTVGFGCTTCNGNSGPLSSEISDQITARNITAAAVLSGNRNFAGRIHPLVQASYLASPALVIAYAIAGSVLSDLTRTPLGFDTQGRAVMLSDIWPSDTDVAELASYVSSDLYRSTYREKPLGHAQWADIAAPAGALYPWRTGSTFIAPSPIPTRVPADQNRDTIDNIRPLVILGDSITTDHISPNGAILKGTPAAQFLTQCGVAQGDFGTYAARRGNYEIALRGTFANPYLQNEMQPRAQGNMTLLMPEERPMSIYEAGMAYVARGTPAIIVAGRNYGSGS